MSTSERDLIKRIHDAINRSLADRLEMAQLIRSLQAENSQLQHELNILRTRPTALNGAFVVIPTSVGSVGLRT